MAENHDGSVKIDTALDNSGFDKGSKELEKAIRELCAEIKNMGATLKTAFDGYTKAIQTVVSSTVGMQTGMSDTNAQATQLQSAIQGVRTAADQMKTSMASNTSQIQAMQNSIEEIKIAVNDLKASGSERAISFERPKQQSFDLLKQIQSLARSLDSLSSTAKKASFSIILLNRLGPNRVFIVKA